MAHPVYITLTEPRYRVTLGVVVRLSLKVQEVPSSNPELVDFFNFINTHEKYVLHVHIYV